MTAPNDLARLGLVIAAALERAGNPTPSGVVRQLAAAVVDLAAQLDALQPPPTADGCRVCGRSVEQPPTGRRRLYCGDKCRRAADHRNRTRNGRNGSMVP